MGRSDRNLVHIEEGLFKMGEELPETLTVMSAVARAHPQLGDDGSLIRNGHQVSIFHRPQAIELGVIQSGERGPAPGICSHVRRRNACAPSGEW